MKLSRTKFDELAVNFPHIVDEMRLTVRSYRDEKMEFRRKAVSNIPWLRNVSDTVIKHIMEEVVIMRVGKGGEILKRGDKSN